MKMLEGGKVQFFGVDRVMKPGHDNLDSFFNPKPNHWILDKSDVDTQNVYDVRTRTRSDLCKCVHRDTQQVTQQKKKLSD